MKSIFFYKYQNVSTAKFDDYFDDNEHCGKWNADWRFNFIYDDTSPL